MSDLEKSYMTSEPASHDITFYGGSSAKPYLTITHDGRMIIGEGLSMEEATQQAARMLADKFNRMMVK